ncbi:MAG: hypothetical protein ACP5IJ_02335 [Candidatus Nanoarchaeia archaeon]
MENEEIIIPKASKEKTPWSKIFAILTILFMAGWALALYVEKEPAQKNFVEQFNVSNYVFYKLKDGTFSTAVDVKGQKIPVAFYLDPRNASNIPISKDLNFLLSAKKVYITFNPNQENLSAFAIAAAQISRILALYDIKVVGAYTEDTKPIDPNVPIKTCADATELNPVIFLSMGNSSEINVSKYCVNVRGADPQSLVFAADKLGYALLGIKV